MNESTRTLTFLAVAGVLAAASYGMHVATRPTSLDEYSDVGAEFYPDFKEPREATGLRVAAYNEEAARVEVFNVDFKNGMWRIPSHHNYPADGEEQLAKTATSIIGLQRDALVSKSPDDHKRLGVLDPLDETVTGTEGRGDRITLTKADQTLADYIIGKKVENGPENTYNIRRADEDRTYRVTLNIDISTKFADWIDPNLLDFRRGDIRKLVVDRYSIDETRGVLVQEEKSELTRNSQDDPWKLAGLDDPEKKVKVSTVNTMVNGLEDLAIVGVRPKPAGLSADLKQGSIIAKDGTVSMSAVRDLQARGFFLLPDGSLKSNEGEVTVALANGVKYVLGFGEVFTGSDVEIEVGKSSAKDVTDAKEDDQQAPKDESEAATARTDAPADADADATDENASLKKSRYLFILAQLDESAIEPLPEKPVKPEPPKEKSADADEPAKDEPESADAESADAESADAKTADEAADGDDAPDEESAAPAAEETKTDDAAPTKEEEYQQALADYETKLKDWELRQQQRDEKVKAGTKRVEELNARFAEWYYVISAEKFDDIRVKSDELVEAATSPNAGAGASPLNNLPGMSAPPAITPPAQPPVAAPDAEPATETPKTETPASEEPKSDTPAADTPEPEAPEPKKPADESDAASGTPDDASPEAAAPDAPAESGDSATESPAP